MATALFFSTEPLPTDDELAERIQSGDTAAFDLLHARYERLLQQTTYRYFLVGGDREDLLQIARLGLWRAARMFQPGKGSTFGSWVKFIVRREMADAIRYTMRESRRLPSQALSLDAPAQQTDHSTLTMANTWVDKTASAEQPLEQAEQVRELIGMLARCLTTLEWRVFIHLLAHRSMDDTARQLGLPRKSIDNARWRVRHKVRAMRGAEAQI